MRYHYNTHVLGWKVKKTDHDKSVEGVKEWKLLYIDARNVKWYNVFGKQFGRFLKMFTDTYYLIQSFHS